MTFRPSANVWLIGTLHDRFLFGTLGPNADPLLITAPLGTGRQPTHHVLVVVSPYHKNWPLLHLIHICTSWFAAGSPPGNGIFVLAQTSYLRQPRAGQIGTAPANMTTLEETPRQSQHPGADPPTHATPDTRLGPYHPLPTAEARRSHMYHRAPTAAGTGREQSTACPHSRGQCSPQHVDI